MKKKNSVFGWLRVELLLEMRSIIHLNTPNSNVFIGHIISNNYDQRIAKLFTRIQENGSI